MDNKQVAREMLKDFQAKFPASKRHNTCPFAIYHPDSYFLGKDIIKEQLHDLCGQLFPRWAKFNLKPTGILKCPCHTLSHSYVRRKARQFIKEGK